MCNSTHPPCFKVVVFEHNKQIQAYSPPHRALFQSEKCSFFEHYPIINDQKFQKMNGNYGCKALNILLTNHKKGRKYRLSRKKGKKIDRSPAFLQAIGLCSYFEH